MFHLLDRQGGGCTNPVTRVSDIMGWGLDVINKLAPRAAAAQHVYYCGNCNGWRLEKVETKEDG